eukprot:6213429-Pleurochrysis_carterae.AAC.2
MHAQTRCTTRLRAASDLKAHLPLFFAFIDKPHRRGEYDYEALRKSLVERADALFLAVQASHLIKVERDHVDKGAPRLPPLTLHSFSTCMRAL